RVDGNTFLSLNGVAYTSAGGTVTGPHQFINSTIASTAPATTPTTLVLRGGNNTLVSALQANTTLQVLGTGGTGDAVLAVSGNDTSYGTIQLTSSGGGFASTLSVTNTLHNAGVLDIQPGSGGARNLNGAVGGTFINDAAGAITGSGNLPVFNIAFDSAG